MHRGRGHSFGQTAAHPGFRLAASSLRPLFDILNDANGQAAQVVAAINAIPYAKRTRYRQALYFPASRTPMAEHHATVGWQRGDAVFTDNRYSQAHAWAFDGGTGCWHRVRRSTYLHRFATLHGSTPGRACVAALASCHMLWFLGLAAQVCTQRSGVPRPS